MKISIDYERKLNIRDLKFQVEGIANAVTMIEYYYDGVMKLW